MAEGGTSWQRSFKDSFSKASGDADESFCDPCKGEDKHIAVKGYCPVCDEYLCETCLGVHRKQKMTRAHAILDKNEMPSGQASTGNQDLCVDVCKSHHPEIIRFYCKAHDMPGCGDCMTLNHTACKKDRVQDISDGFQNTREFADIDKQLQQLYQQIQDMEGELDNNLKNLDKTYNNILRKIAAVRKQINEYLDQIQKKITDEAAQMKNEEKKELKTLQAENQAMKSEIETMLKTLHDTNANVNSLFVTTKQAKNRLVTMQTEINKINQLQQQQQYEFQISNEIEQIILAKTPLGKLSRKSSQKMRTMTKTPYQKTPRTPSIDTTVTYNTSINVRCKTDMADCWITDCIVLCKDKLAIIDQTNKNIKLIDLNNNTVISSYDTSSKPWRVTALSTTMIAVTLPEECKIQVLNVTSTFTLQREIKVNNKCYGIAYKDGKFAVGNMDPGSVDILDIQGTVLHTIQPSGDTLRQPNYIIFGHDYNTVIVSDYRTHKVSVVTFRGQILRTYTHDTLRGPRGIVITADGLLLVCSWWNGCIHVVSPDFKTSRIIINNDNHVMDPAGITYYEMSHTLYISNTRYINGGELYNKIQVYDLNV